MHGDDVGVNPVEQIRAQEPGLERPVDIRGNADAVGWRLIRDWFAQGMGRALTAREENQVHDWLTGHPVYLSPDQAWAARSGQEIERFQGLFVALGDLLASPSGGDDS